MRRKSKYSVLAAAGMCAVCSMHLMTAAALPALAIQNEAVQTAGIGTQQWTDDGQHYKVTTQNDPLNMRSAPDASAAIITTIPKGTIVTVLQTSDGWGKVQYGSLTGYCKMDWLTLSPDSVPAVQNNAQENEQIIYNYLTQTLGLSCAAACGVIGNMHVETGGTFDPEIHNNPAAGEPLGYGICQWNSGKNAGYRLEELQAFSPEWKTLKCQLEFIKHDLLENSYLLNLHLYDDMKAFGNTEADAVAASDRWAICYEGCAEWTYAERREKARFYYHEHNGAAAEWKTVSMRCTVATESGSLNMRSAASMSGAVLMMIPKGAEVSVTSISDDGKWGKVEYKGTTGYCVMEYLKENVSAPATVDTFILGDLNGNAEIGPDDAQITLKAYTERITGNNMNLTDQQLKAADIDKDGQITAVDAQMILMYYTTNVVSGKKVAWEKLLTS